MLDIRNKSEEALLALATSGNTSSMDRYILAEAPFTKVLSSLLKNKTLSEETIEAISENPKSDSLDVASLIASHQNVPEKVLQKMISEGSSKIRDIILSNASPKKMKNITFDDNENKSLLRVAMVKEVGLASDELLKIYEKLDSPLREDTFNELFVNNPFSGAAILQDIYSNTDDRNIILAIASNRSAGEDTLRSILERYDGKSIDVANALVENTNLPADLGEAVFSKFKDNLDESVLTNITKRNLSLVSEKTLALVHGLTKSRENKKKIVRVLDKRQSIYRLMLPEKMYEIDKKWIIGKADTEDMKTFAKIFPGAEAIFINYWSSISQQTNSSEKNEKMKEVFSDHIWKDKGFDDFKKILLSTKNIEVSRTIIHAQELPDEKEELLLAKLVGVAEDNLFEKTKNIALMLKNDNITKEDLIVKLTELKGRAMRSGLETSPQIIAFVDDLIISTEESKEIKKRSAAVGLQTIWESISGGEDRGVDMDVKKGDVIKQKGDIFYMRNFSNLFDIACEIDSKDGIHSALKFMSPKEKTGKTKEVLASSFIKKRQVMATITGAVPKFTGATEGTKEKSNEEQFIIEIEREIFRTGNPAYISVCEGKRAFSNPTTKEGVENAARTAEKYLNRGFSTLSEAEKDEFMGPLFDNYTSFLLTNSTSTKDLTSAYEYTKERFGVQKFKRITEALSQNTSALDLSSAIKLIKESSDLSFPMIAQKEKWENGIAASLFNGTKNIENKKEISAAVLGLSYGSLEMREVLSEEGTIVPPEKIGRKEKVAAPAIPEENRYSYQVISDPANEEKHRTSDVSALDNGRTSSLEVKTTFTKVSDTQEKTVTLSTNSRTRVVDAAQEAYVKNEGEEDTIRVISLLRIGHGEISNPEVVTRYIATLEGKGIYSEDRDKGLWQAIDSNPYFDSLYTPGYELEVVKDENEVSASVLVIASSEKDKVTGEKLVLTRKKQKGSTSLEHSDEERIVDFPMDVLKWEVKNDWALKVGSTENDKKIESVLEKEPIKNEEPIRKTLF